MTEHTRKQYDIVFRKATYAEFISRNRVLRLAEPAYEIDTGRMKIGDGVRPYDQLPYYIGGPQELDAALEAHLQDPTPHSVYDNGPSLVLLYENKKV